MAKEVKTPKETQSQLSYSGVSNSSGSSYYKNDHTKQSVTGANSRRARNTLAERSNSTDDGSLTIESASSQFSLISSKLLSKTQTTHNKNEFFVDNLRAKFKDLSKPNLFKLTFKLNLDSLRTLKSKNNVLEQSYYLLKSVTMPAMTTSKITIPYHGCTYHFPGDTTFEDVSLVFWNDDNMDIRKFFVEWQTKYVSNHLDGRSALQTTNLYNSLEIQQFNSNLEPVFCVELMHIFPTSISELQLSHENGDTRSDTTISFSFSNMIHYVGS